MITFNIEEIPPTTEQLVAARQHSVATIQAYAKREKHSLFWLLVIILLSISLIVGLWQLGYITGEDAFVCVITFSLTLTFMVLFFIVRACELLSESKAVGMMFAVFWSLVVAGFWNMAAPMGSALALVVFAIITALLAKLNSTARSANNMDELVDLEYTDQIDECILFDAWRDQDETIRAYSNALVAMDRKPVMAEFAAARHWIETKDQRMIRHQKEMQARAACKRMSQAV